MKIRTLVCGICLSAAMTLGHLVTAGEIYYWVDEKGVKRFSDAPTDRDTIRKKATSYQGFEGKPSNAPTEQPGITRQENSTIRSAANSGDPNADSGSMNGEGRV